MMNDTPKFTPGPWVREAQNVYASGGLQIVASTKPHVHGMDWPTAEANAALIAAAPDLYAALEDALNALAQFVDTSAKTRKPYEHPLSAYDRGQDALAKARGRA